MLQKLLIEIGVEELPAIPLIRELTNIQKSWFDILHANALAGDFEFYYTPRRLVLWHEAFRSRQDDSIEELYGAPIKIAYDQDGNPTAAALGFAKKCGVSVDELGRSTKNNQEVLYYKKHVEGLESVELLESMIDEWLGGMSFGKSMRWADCQKSFIRPIRWVNVLLDNREVELQIYGVKSASTTELHRMVEQSSVVVSDAKEYFKALEDGFIILDNIKRKSKILREFKDLEDRHSVQIEVDQDLLEEIVAITEYPTALLGSFDEKFLALPPEVIITSMKEHQRYFAVYKDAKLTNSFVVVSNAATDDFDQIIRGNERVLRPRLEDALFFYNNDLKAGLSIDALDRVGFLDKLGSLREKIEREREIAQALASIYSDRSVDAKLLDRALYLAKADLSSEMVYEFTELQGVMGSYYAKAQGEDEAVVLGIREQYLPDSENSPLPSTVFSSLVSLSIKLDTIFSLFSINMIPTGSRDPFALRRAVNGIVRISLKHRVEFEIDKTVKLLSQNYSNIDYEKLENFFIERLYGYYDVNPSIIKAVLGSGEREILRIDAKIKALSSLLLSDGFELQFSTFKRVANITKDLNLLSDLHVDEALLELEAERSLYGAFKDCQTREYDGYEEQLDALFALKEQLDNFFDTVMVNVEDRALQENRKALIGSIYKAILNIADIKEITL